MVSVVAPNLLATAILLRGLPRVRFEACAPQAPVFWFSGRPYQFTFRLPGSTRFSVRMAPWAVVTYVAVHPPAGIT